MKTIILSFLFVATATAYAQPDDWMERHRNPCGFAPNDSIDITHDGIPDLVVQGIRSGTDDEPSSSGTCYLYVMNLPGTTLLNIRDAQGNWAVKVCAKGDNIPAAPTRPQDDLQIPKLFYTDGSVQVAYWGYGHQSAEVAITPDLWSKHYVFQTNSNGTSWHGSFTVEPPTRMERVNVRVGALVPKEEPFIVQ